MKHHKKFIITIVSIIAVNAVAVAGWWYVFNMIEKEKNSVEQMLKDINVGEKRLNNIRSLNNLLKDTEEDAEKISAVFLNSENIVKFVEELEFLGQKSGVSLAIKSVALPEESGTEKPRFVFQIKGSFRDLFQYLLLLESVPYQVRLDKVSFAKPKKENWQVDFEIMLLSYSYGDTD